MAMKDDVQVLHQAGIADVNKLVHSAAEFIREHPMYTVKSSPGALSPSEARILSSGGAIGVREEPGAKYSQGPVSNLTQVAGQYAQLVESALTAAQVAERLGVTPSRVRQRTEARTLYAIATGSGRVYPRWQFSDSGTIPGLARILDVLSRSAHPVAVERFMLTVHPDLESSEVGSILCPRDWLIAGHSPEDVALMAREL